MKTKPMRKRILSALRSAVLLSAALLCAAFLLFSPPAVAALAAEEEIAPSPSSVILSSYRVVGGSLMTGERITLSFTLENTGADGTVTDVLLTYIGNESSMYPVFGETNTSYLPSIPPGTSVEIEKEFNLSESAPATITLGIELRYRESGSPEYITRENKIYLPVFGRNSLSINLNVAGTVYVGSPIIVNGYCGNAGSRDMFGLTAVFSGDILEGETGVPLGSLPKGEQLSLQQPLSFAESGVDKRLSLSFTFADADGNLYRIPSQEYLVTVLEPPSGLPALNTNPSSGVSPDSTVAILLILALVLLAAVLGVLYRNRRGNTKK